MIDTLKRVRGVVLFVFAVAGGLATFGMWDTEQTALKTVGVGLLIGGSLLVAAFDLGSWWTKRLMLRESRGSVAADCVRLGIVEIMQRHETVVRGTLGRVIDEAKSVLFFVATTSHSLRAIDQQLVQKAQTCNVRVLVPSPYAKEMIRELEKMLGRQLGREIANDLEFYRGLVTKAGGANIRIALYNQLTTFNGALYDDNLVVELLAPGIDTSHRLILRFARATPLFQAYYESVNTLFKNVRELSGDDDFRSAVREAEALDERSEPTGLNGHHYAGL